LGYLLGVENDLREGRLALAVDFSGRRSGARGTATLGMTNVCIGRVDGLSGNIDVSMDGRKVTGSINAVAAGVGTLKVTKLDLEVGGRGPLDSASWRRTWGTVEVDGKADLAKLVALLPPNSLPFAIVAGQVALKGHAERGTESDVTPDVSLSLKTSNLVLSPQSAPDEKGDPTITHPQGWQMVGVDVQVVATANGKTGATTLDTRLLDKHGEIASLEAKSAAIPYGPLLASSDGAAARMMNVAVSATITVPARKLAQLPDLLRPDGASGDIEGSITLDGTCLHPKVEAHIKAQSIKFGTSPLLTPLDADATAKYDGARGDVVLDVRSGAATLLHASARADARVADMARGAANGTPWNASLNATLTHFPLESISPLADRRMHGNVSGRLELTDWHKDARATADLDVDGLRVGKAKYGGGKMMALFDGQTLSAKLRLDQEGGFANGEAKLGMLWGSNAAPSLDPAGSMQASLQAKHFSAAFLQPFLQSTVDEIDGTVDADAQISSSAGKKPEMKGSAVLSNGLVEPIALGQEFRAVNAKVTFTPDGVVKLESMSAQGTGGKVTASGVARVDGTALVGAQATVNIAKKDAMPLDVQGANLGTIYGQFVLKATTSADRKTMNLDMDVPSLHVLLPEASTHSVQDLDGPTPQDHVGVYASPGRFVTLPVDGEMAAASKGGSDASTANPLTVVVHLGKDVEIRRGTDIKVTLDGAMVAKLDQKTHVTGQIRLLGGKLDVEGKSFEIETGTVTFVGDPSNPLIKVTAGWTAGDGTRVLADYVGPLKTGKVTLRSEPARPKNEIVALILFGTADGSQATPYATPQPDVATRAGTTVGGMATGGLSKGLDKLTGMDISTKIDTSQQNPRPEVEVQVAKDISLQLAFVIGQPPPGTNPDTTYATIDWRFARSWSLETTFGDQGSSMADVVWQHRY
jgi:translocation and assembly module TamB